MVSRTTVGNTEALSPRSASNFVDHNCAPTSDFGQLCGTWNLYSTIKAGGEEGRDKDASIIFATVGPLGALKEPQVYYLLARLT